MVKPTEVRERMPVVDCGGLFVGKVDLVKGHTIRLAGDSPGALGRPRFLPLEWVVAVDDCVHLGKTCSTLQANWKTANRVTGF
jgi:hypothetical protein